jgi:5-methylcytosine-specific restriction endonuclease McrA
VINIKQTCPKCGKEFNIECKENLYRRGIYRKFCSRKCANSHSLTEEQKQHISEGLKKSDKIHHAHIYVCESCGKFFSSSKRFRNGRKIHCDDCIQKRKHSKEGLVSPLDCSKRTVTKIIKRAKKGCSICGWNESTCDIHHIIPRSKGGSDDSTNLIIVCPNCHRVIHTTEKYNKDFLMKHSIFLEFANWRDYYYPSN